MTDLGVSTTRANERAVLGASPTRPDGVAKVQGTFEFSSDLGGDGVLWGATLRSPHPYATIVRIDLAPAWQIDGVAAVLTAGDVPGQLTYGLIDQDQPVLADGVVRYVGQPVAIVAADHPETCRRALAAIVVEYDVLQPVLDPETVVDGSAPPIHPMGNVIRHQRIHTGDPDATGDVVVEGTYQIGMQDQAFLGLEAALAVPDSGGGGVELHVATQWLHEDRKQIAACLGLAEPSVRLVMGGVGGAFGAREDISLQVHCCMLALHLGRPVRMHYTRAESFLGHVHRHPATIWMRHHATAAGEIVKIEARFVFDGGAYASTSSAVLLNAITHTQGPYRCANAIVDGWAVRTNHLPCGAMRGFGVVQACFAHEAQLDRLAEACGVDPVEIRVLNAIRTGDPMITGQILENVAPVEECLRAAEALPFPDEPVGGSDGDPAAPARWCRPDGRRRARHPRHRVCRHHEEPDVLGRVRRLLHGPLPACRRRGHAQVRHRRGRPGLRHAGPADRANDPGRRRGRAGARRHRDRLGRLVLGVTSDLDERWRGEGRMRCRAARDARRRGDSAGSFGGGADRPRHRSSSTSPAAAKRYGSPWRRRRVAGCSRRLASTTTRRPRTSTRTVTATATRRSRSAPNVRSWTSTSSWGW